MERLGTLPFVAQPGEAWVYGYNTDMLGCVVERASGMPLDQFVRTRITEPLGMKDTQFFLPPRAARSAGGGVCERQRRPHHACARRARKARGITSTARARASRAVPACCRRRATTRRFLEMIRNGGALDGVRILAPRTVKLMTTNQVGTLHSSNGLGFGFGFETTDRYGANGMDRRARTDGAARTARSIASIPRRA